MSDFVVKFLTSLTDHELSVYVGHMSGSFILETKQKVKAEISKRNLSKEQFIYLSKKKLTYPEDGKFCKKCGSNKFTFDKDVEHRDTGRYTSADVGVVTTRCILCNYNPSKSPTKNIFEKIRRIFSDDNEEVYILKEYWSIY